MNLSNLSLSQINKKVTNEKNDFIMQCEKHYEKEIEKVCDMILANENLKLVLLAGPSSSGKTTTANMIAKKLAQKGKKAKPIAFDHFYFDQTNTYKFEDGTTDLETIKSLDTKLLVKCLKELIETETSMLPEFDFTVKLRKADKVRYNLGKDEIIILEGLHALNPEITDNFDDETMLKLYVSVSSRIHDDDNNVIFSKRDLRFIRRLIRDYHYRSSSVENTYYLWNGVLMGEDRYIFPFSHLASYKIESIHAYEVCVFKQNALELLRQVEEGSIYYEKATELIGKLEKCCELHESDVPSTSLLEEFIKRKKEVI